jgi:hypothetical protein
MATLQVSYCSFDRRVHQGRDRPARLIRSLGDIRHQMGSDRQIDTLDKPLNPLSGDQGVSSAG